MINVVAFVELEIVDRSNDGRMNSSIYFCSFISFYTFLFMVHFVVQSVRAMKKDPSTEVAVVSNSDFQRAISSF